MLGTIAERARCMRVARVLQSYLDGEVEPPTARAVEEHLEECRRCGLAASTYLAIKTAIAASGASTRPSVDAEAVERLRAFARQLSDDGRRGA